MKNLNEQVQEIIKRDGHIVDYCPEKIEKAIKAIKIKYYLLDMKIMLNMVQTIAKEMKMVTFK